MKAIGLTLISMALLVPCLAVPDFVLSGPYNISFDLSISKDYYKVIISDPEEGELLSGDVTTTYQISILRPNSTGDLLVTLSESNSTLPASTPTVFAQYAKKELSDMGATHIEVAERAIDGTKCGIASGKWSLGEVYSARFNVKAAHPSRHLVCAIFSTCPWDEGTLQLLKTIHIKRNAAA